MADINKVNTKPNENETKLSFLRCSSKKRLSFEQSLAIKDLSTFSTSCKRGKLYQIIQSNQNSLFSFDSFNMHHKTKNDLFHEGVKQEPELNESHLDLNRLNLTLNHLVENEEEKDSEFAIDELSNVSNRQRENDNDNSNNSNDNDNNYSYNSDNNDDNNNDLMITTLIQNDKRCDVCSCSIF
jgi:hypothetical protein